MGKNMDGKSSIRGGGDPTPDGKSHEKFHFFDPFPYWMHELTTLKLKKWAQKLKIPIGPFLPENKQKVDEKE